MNFLPDTHLLLWSYDNPSRMSASARELILDESNGLYFSAMSIWEVAIKSAALKRDFAVDPHALRRGLLASGYIELPITSEHALAVPSLPLIHRDPFDRILIAQATVEGITLLTSDRQIAQYPGPILKV